VTTGFAAAQDNFTFPDGFLLGAATASYQIEGGWDADGKAQFNAFSQRLPYLPPGLTFKNSTFCPNSLFMFCTDLRNVITSI